MRLNESDIFLEPVGAELGLLENDRVHILYSPLTEGLALVSGDDARRICSCIEKNKIYDYEDWFKSGKAGIHL